MADPELTFEERDNACSWRDPGLFRRPCTNDVVVRLMVKFVEAPGMGASAWVSTYCADHLEEYERRTDENRRVNALARRGA